MKSIHVLVKTKLKKMNQNIEQQPIENQPENASKKFFFKLTLTLLSIISFLLISTWTLIAVAVKK